MLEFHFADLILVLSLSNSPPPKPIEEWSMSSREVGGAAGGGTRNRTLETTKHNHISARY